MCDGCHSDFVIGTKCCCLTELRGWVLTKSKDRVGADRKHWCK